MDCIHLNCENEFNNTYNIDSGVSWDGGVLGFDDVINCFVADGSGCAYLNNAYTSPAFSDGGPFFSIYTCIIGDATTNCKAGCGF